MAQIETIRKTHLDVVRREKEVGTIPKCEKQRYRRYYRNLLRAQVTLSRLIRGIDFTEPVKRRLVDDVKEITEGVQRIRLEIEHVARQVKATTRRRIMASTGETSCRFSMKSPRWPSSSSPIGVSSEIGCWANLRAFCTVATGRSNRVAISSDVGSRPSSCTSAGDARISLLIVSIM